MNAKKIAEMHGGKVIIFGGITIDKIRAKDFIPPDGSLYLKLYLAGAAAAFEFDGYFTPAGEPF